MKSRINLCVLCVLAVTTSLFAADQAYVLISVQNGKVLGQSNSDLLSKAYPPGSLIKVFTTIAYYQQYGNHFPAFECPATLASDPNGCWDRNGHGEVRITDAIAYSCNVYFRQLAARISPAVFESTLQKFQLADSLRNFDDAATRKIMTGNSLEWRVNPALLLRGYCAIFNGGYLYPGAGRAAQTIGLDSQLRALLQQGMLMSAQKGTSIEARKITGKALLGKTGTSLLWQEGKINWHSTQGWWIGLYPAQKPEVAILTFVTGGRGATDAAPLGGKVLSSFLHSQ